MTITEPAKGQPVQSVGLPVATAELKTDFTQSIDDAVDQYRFDRDPSPKGQNPEPLLSFPSGALVHFAVSSSEVQMTTRLAGPKTNFLPFNQGSNGPGKTGSAGNPVNPTGHKTAYLLERASTMSQKSIVLLPSNSIPTPSKSSLKPPSLRWRIDC